MGNPRYLAFAALAAGPLLGMSPLLGRRQPLPGHASRLLSAFISGRFFVQRWPGDVLRHFCPLHG